MDAIRRNLRIVGNAGYRFLVPLIHIHFLVFIHVVILLNLHFCTLYILPPRLVTTKPKEVGFTGNFSSVYHSPDVFGLSYQEIERDFKVYIYPDGDENEFYHTPQSLRGRYTSEGYFFKNIRESGFRTLDPDKAHLFFIPISCHKMSSKGLSYSEMTTEVKNYVQSLILKYPYWNRTLGSDHFFVTCHEICVRATERVPDLVKNSIRVVCSRSHDTGLMPGFIPNKDITLPLIRQPFSPPADLVDQQKSVVLKWKNDSTTENLGSEENFSGGIKFCRCISEGGMDAICIAYSIYYNCIPVILADHYMLLPFNTTLDWKKFSLVLSEEDFNGLEYPLVEMKGYNFTILYQNLMKVKKHFQWNSPAERHDAFHMVMYELWMHRHVAKYQ